MELSPMNAVDVVDAVDVMNLVDVVNVVNVVNVVQFVKIVFAKCSRHFCCIWLCVVSMHDQPPFTSLSTPLHSTPRQATISARIFRI
jgi:hypothetical protein